MSDNAWYLLSFVLIIVGGIWVENAANADCAEKYGADWCRYEHAMRKR